MKDRPLFLTKCPDGHSEIGFQDEDGRIWYVNPRRLYNSLFYQQLRESYVDQVVLLDENGDLASDIDVYIADDEGDNTYWLFCSQSLVWRNEDDIEVSYGTRNAYFENVMSVLRDYMEVFCNYPSDNRMLKENAFGIILKQFKLQKLVGRDPWQHGDFVGWYQQKYFDECYAVKEKFDIKVRNKDIEWSFSRGNENLRQIECSFIPLTDLEIITLKRALEDFCLTGDCRFRIQSPGTKDVQATTVVLHNVRSGNLSKLGDITEVVISPEDYDHSYPVLYGFSNTHEVLKNLYENFLRRLVPFSYYNNFKSKLIETFLIGANPLNPLATKKVRHLCELAPDYDVHWQDEKGCGVTVEEDVIEITDDPEGYNVIYRAKAPSMADWHEEYVNATDFANTETDESFDYKAWNSHGLALARTIRNQLPDDVDVWYMYPFEDKSHDCDEVLILKSSKQHLLTEARQVLSEEGINNIDQWMELVEAFVAQSPYDSFFDEYTEVCFLDGDLDIYWYTPDLDCRASINLEEFTFHIWNGINHGRKDDECFIHGVGGEGVEKEDGEYCFAWSFYDQMCNAKNLPNPHL